MIISASYRTDIPSFYGDWFMNRLEAGFCWVPNPYGGKPSRVSLARSDVDGFVFWTKNIAPFLRHLDEVHDLGYPFVVQHTINGYPRQLETSVLDADAAIRNAARVRDKFGPRVVVWRYDPIILSTITSAQFHVGNFTRLAEELRGVTDEVVISFAQIYRKTKRNMDGAASASNFRWWDPSSDQKREIVRSLVEIAQSMDMRVSVCSQQAYVVEGAAEARCIDADRLSDVAGGRVKAKLKGNRKECGCFESRDIGDYDTCPHGCVYCYAVRQRDMALARFRQHEPASPFLFPSAAAASEPADQSDRTPEGQQLVLFSDDR